MHLTHIFQYSWLALDSKTLMNQACLVSSYHFPELSLVSLSHLSMGLHELSRLLYQSPKTVYNTCDLVSKAKETEITKLTY